MKFSIKSKINDFSVGQKIIGLVVIILLLMGGSMGYPLLQFKQMNTDFENMAKNDLPLTAAMSDVALKHTLQAVWVERAIRHGQNVLYDESLKENLKNAEKKFLSYEKKIKSRLQDLEILADNKLGMARTAKQKEVAQGIIEQVQMLKKETIAYNKLGAHVFELARTNQMQVIDKLAGKLQKSGTNLEQILSKTTALIDNYTRESVGKVSNSQFLIAKYAAISIPLIFILAIAFSLLVTRQIKSSLNKAIGVAASIADGDLTVEIEHEGSDEAAQMLDAMEEMNLRLRNVIQQVSSSVDTMSVSAKEIVQGNINLSHRTESQASSLEETASSMEEMTSTVKQNAENARLSNKLAHSTQEKARDGGKAIDETIQAMNQIQQSSKKIADIIAVIDEIAFQINLLALNAAVEAARAGEQGRGFAVVATEVRNLAQRSSKAAEEVKVLINDSVEKVKIGADSVHASGQTLKEIIDSVEEMTDIVSEIAAASQEQSSGIEQVNHAVIQMDEMTQQNAALVEQATAASNAMDEQASKLNNLIQFFKVSNS